MEELVSILGKDITHHRRSGLLHLSPINVGRKERIASAILGGAFLLRALRRRSPFGFLLGLLGGTMLLRGITGHCELNERFGRNTAKMSERLSDGVKSMLRE